MNLGIAKRWILINIVVVTVIGCAATARQESVGQYQNDSSITGRVKAAFVGDSEVSALAIKVDTHNGVVRLSGFANSSAEVNRAVLLARRVDGVKSVENDVQLK